MSSMGSRSASVSLSAFGYLLNFLVDGSIVLNCLLLYWALGFSGRDIDTEKLFEGRASNILVTVLDTMIPSQGDLPGAVVEGAKAPKSGGIRPVPIAVPIAGWVCRSFCSGKNRARCWSLN